MTVYTKSMMESLAEVRRFLKVSLAEVRDIQEDNMDLMRKAAGGSAQNIKMKDGKLKMDAFTASAIMKVYDKVNPANKKKIETIINSGKKNQMMKLQSMAMKAIKSDYDAELDEAVKRGTLKDLENLEKSLRDAKKKKDKKKADALQKELEALMKSGLGKKIGPDWMHKEETELDEMKSKSYALAVKGKIVAVGSKADMMKLKKQKGGEIYMSPGAKVGDKAEEVELDEALPSHLQKFFDKDGNPKSKEGKAAWERIAKSKGFKKYTDKQIKMAIGVAFDKRYVQGNMTGAAKTIEKIAKGLSNIEPVRDALRRANENTILDRIDAKLREKKNG